MEKRPGFVVFRFPVAFLECKSVIAGVFKPAACEAGAGLWGICTFQLALASNFSAIIALRARAAPVDSVLVSFGIVFVSPWNDVGVVLTGKTVAALLASKLQVTSSDLLS